MNEEEIIKESNRCLNCASPMCKQNCPLSNNIPQMIAQVKDGNFEEAYKIDQETNPLGAICGLVCPHEKQCEGACVRGIKETPVKIGTIEAFVCNHFVGAARDHQVTTHVDRHKVAIIGGGPAGLSCAYFLSKQNIPSTIFEKEEKLGGILEYGIPDFRLDKTLVQKSIECILDDNIEVKLNHPLTISQETIDDLKSQGYEYIFICIGNESSKVLNIPAIDNPHVLHANDFLHEYKNHDEYKGKSFAIIGGRKRCNR